jgi:Transglycosylase SLT domain
MPAGRRLRTAALVGAVSLGLTGLVGGATLTLTHSDAVPARPAYAGVGSTTSPAPATSPARQAALAVPPLAGLTPPDVVVRLTHPVSGGAVSRLRAAKGVRHVVVADRGLIRIHGVALRVLGVPLRGIRGFTPSLTATATPLWQSIARGELTASYSDPRRLTRQLGATYSAVGSGGAARPVRLGAVATLGLPGVQGLLSRPAAAALGVGAGEEVLIAAPRLSVTALRSVVVRTLGATARVTVTRAVKVNQALMSSYARSMVPASYLELYRRAAPTCPGLPWTVLAGIGTVETGNGRDVHRSTAGAEGPMQFIPSTWATWGYDADGDGRADVNDPTDAVFSAARYLCAAGAGLGGQALNDAIFAYNHAWWYVREVVTLANEYA